MNEGMLGFPRGYGLTPNQPSFDSILSVNFAAVTEVILDNCFTPPYAHYRLMLDFSAWSTNSNMVYQFRTANGTPYISADYDTEIMNAQAASQSASGALAQTSARVGQMYSSPGVGACVVDFINPQRIARTVSFSQATSMNSTTAAVWESDATLMKVTTQMTGLRVTASDGLAVFTGTARLYGYRLR